MTDWHLHWLEAEGDLSRWRSGIAFEIDKVRQAIERILPLPRLDILVQRLPGAVIPEIGMLGIAYRKGLFSLTIDPDNIHFERSLQDGALQRQVAHEAHHCLRMAGPGYGLTLGEALISEGLAGNFVRRVLGSGPEAWERVEVGSLRNEVLTPKALQATDYDHGAWFFGVNGPYPRWLGYTLGYQIVGDWLLAQRVVTADTWVNVRAEVILAKAGF